jgi:BirA family transcriptional regulator, biotin operon repressor / biotin---[acetyl-CoA-carboxylase] ligase
MSGWPEGVDKRIHQSVDSTMAEAARLAADLAGPTWVMAHHQTSARGRRGREWMQPVGNFSATLIWEPVGSVEARAQRSFVAALALRDTLVALTGRDTGLGLKWPNDVLLNGGKLAGILLESMGRHLAIGFGVNLISTPHASDLPDEAVPPASLMGETGLRVTPEEFLNQMAPAFAKREAQFTTFGFQPIRTDWLAHAARLGEVITARTGTQEFTGTFETVDDQGVLVLNASDGRHLIAAADVFF